VARRVIAMIVLNAAEEREFVIRPHVKLERREPRPPAVVDPFGVLAVALPARLPVAFEQSARVIGERTEQLGATKVCCSEAHCHRDSDEPPGRAAPPHLQPPPVTRCKDAAVITVEMTPSSHPVNAQLGKNEYFGTEMSREMQRRRLRDRRGLAGPACQAASR